MLLGRGLRSPSAFLVKAVEECFAKVIGRYTPSHSEFITVLSDVQKVLNNRPLTYLSQENEVDIITPNHLLVGRLIPSLLFGDLNLDPEWEYYDEDNSSVLSKTIEWGDSVFWDFKRLEFCIQNKTTYTGSGGCSVYGTAPKKKRKIV